MKKQISLIIVLLFLGITNAFAQLPPPPDPGDDDPVVGDPPVGDHGGLIAEFFVTITIDFQPILQLQMTTPTQVDFIFDNIQAYHSGIVKHSATILKVSSSVQWDLYAVATSQDGEYWDSHILYPGGGINAVGDLPLSLLELHQHNNNIYADGQDCNAATPCDYSLPFLPKEVVQPGRNSIYYHGNPYIAPGTNEKYIYGHTGTGPFQGVPGGSYITDGPNDYYFAIDYRILPGLPPVFPAAGDNDGTPLELVGGQYAAPGVYSANVKFILMEDQ